MIESVRYQNFKGLRDATLQLGAFTLLVGPNGSGKTSALQALRLVAHGSGFEADRMRTQGTTAQPELFIQFSESPSMHVHSVVPSGSSSFTTSFVPKSEADRMRTFLASSRFFAFDPMTLATPVSLAPNAELGDNGQNLSAAVDGLRDKAPELFERLNADVASWLPEFDRVLFDTPNPGTREILLRVASSQKPIRASELSHGTLFALALLTLANLPSPPPFIAIEEPDRGIHPRMLRRVRDALYRLAFPSDYSDSRAPVQVVITTHSPFLLDLYRDHPEQVVMAERKGGGAEFSRLVDRADISELLGDASLGDLWYSGILGGVPLES